MIRNKGTVSALADPSSRLLCSRASNQAQFGTFGTRAGAAPPAARFESLILRSGVQSRSHKTRRIAHEDPRLVPAARADKIDETQTILARNPVVRKYLEIPASLPSSGWGAGRRPAVTDVLIDASVAVPKMLSFAGPDDYSHARGIDASPEPVTRR